MIDFLVFIYLNCSADLILSSADKLRDFIAVVNDFVDSDEVVAGGLERPIVVDVDDDIEVALDATLHVLRISTLWVTESSSGTFAFQ